MRTDRYLFLGLVLVLLYAALHTWWVADYPPMRNDDHFNSAETVPAQLANPALFPDDLAWSNTRFARSHGFLFLGAVRLAEALFGSVRDAWGAFTFLFILVYVPGFWLFLRQVEVPPAPALLVALGSTLPVYLYVTFANWGVTSMYAHVFVTVQAGWLLAAFVFLLRRVARVWAWALLGGAVGLTIYFNPVNGGGLLGIFGGLLLWELRWGRLAKSALPAFMGGALLAALPYGVTYSAMLREGVGSPTPQAAQAAQDFLRVFFGARLYPWHWGAAWGALVLGAAGLAAGVLFALEDRLNRPLRFALVGVLLLPGYLMTGSAVFLLAWGYWLLRPGFDRWDKLFLAMVAVVNLIAPITAALSQYLWLEAGQNLFFTLAYEPIRLLRWVLVAVYVFVARWMAAEWARGETLNRMAAAAMLATMFGIFGANNPVKDDAVLMKTFLPVRWALPLFALAVVGLTSSPHHFWRRISPSLFTVWGGVIFALLGLGFVAGMRPWQGIALQGWLIAALLVAGTLVFWQPRTRSQFGLLAFFVATFILPISGYHKAKPDLNWCDVPNLNACADGAAVVAAGTWLQHNTPLEIKIMVIGLQPERFQPLALRSTLHVNIPQIYWFSGAEALLEALRVRDVLATANPLRPNYGGDAALFAALTQLDAHYIVVIGGGYTFDLPIAYENESVSIYEYTRNPNR